MKKYLFSLIVVLSLSFASVPTIASAALFDGAKDEACNGASLGGNCDATSVSKVNGIIETSLNVFSAVIGIIAVVMIMVGGIKYITSQGDSAQTATAKNTILYAAVGLVVAALAQFIVQFVLSRFK